MKAESIKFKTIDQYIATFPASTQRMLKQLRETINKAAPKATEVISYNMPAFKLEGVLVYFAGYKGHIGLYPTGSGIVAFKNELTNYETSKGTVRFPLDAPLPLKLITQMVKFRAAENLEKAKLKKAK